MRPVLITIGKGWPVENQAFYQSTDTSNQYGFKGVFFPFQRVEQTKDSLWFVKVKSYQSDEWRDKICEIFDFDCKSILKSLGLEKTGASFWRKEVVKCCEIYKNFLNKFSNWNQVRSSAMLGGEFWDRKDMNFLKGLALSFDYVDGKYLYTGREEMEVLYFDENPKDVNSILVALDAYVSPEQDEWMEYKEP